MIIPWLDAFYSVKPDSTFPAQLVSFGTSVHRGSSLIASFNELHILAIVQAVVDYRLQAGITGPMHCASSFLMSNAVGMMLKRLTMNAES